MGGSVCRGEQLMLFVSWRSRLWDQHLHYGTEMWKVLLFHVVYTVFGTRRRVAAGEFLTWRDERTN